MQLFHSGNAKLSKNTLIFNMSAAIDCPSRKFKLCKVPHLCYAIKPETNFCSKVVLPARRNQEKYWLNNSAETILSDILKFIKNRPYIRYFRYNESGDFYSLKCIEKLNYVARHLKKRNIITYGYSARADLFRAICPKNLHFIVRISGYTIPGYKSTAVILKGKTAGKQFKTCPAVHSKVQCMEDCTLCAQKRFNIAFNQH